MTTVKNLTVFLLSAILTVLTVLTFFAYKMYSVAPKVKEEASLEFILRYETLGKNVSYLESLLGPAERIEGADRYYRVEGCSLTLKTGLSGSIEGITLDGLSGNCRIDLSRFSSNWPKTSVPVFEDLSDRAKGTFLADCLTSCGNAYDPAVYFHAGGSRSEGWLEFLAETRLIGDLAIDASNKWESAMLAEGEEYVISNRFNCDGKYDQDAALAFARVKVEKITIGRELIQPLIRAC